MHYIESVSILKNNANILGLTIEVVNLKDIRQREENWLFDTGYIQTIDFTNAIFTNVSSLDETDDTSGILLINTLDLNSEFDIAIKNILIDNSSVNFISFGSIVNTPTTSKHLEISNFTYTNSFIETERKLLSTDGIEVDENLFILLNKITFTRLSFIEAGSLISFGHQLSDYVEVNELEIDN